MENSKPTQAERWAAIPGYEGHYEVSDLGRVRGVSRIVRHSSGANKQVGGQILSQLTLRNGYRQVFLWKEGTRAAICVHRLVLLAFVGECPDGMEARHINSVRADNRLCNLAYGTHSENTIDTMKLGRGGRQKLNPKLAKEIVLRAEAGELVKNLAKEFGVSVRSISRIKNRHSYSWIWGETCRIKRYSLANEEGERKCENMS